MIVMCMMMYFHIFSCLILVSGFSIIYLIIYRLLVYIVCHLFCLVKLNIHKFKKEANSSSNHLSFAKKKTYRK